MTRKSKSSPNKDNSRNRRIASESTRTAYLIACEGKNTERDYLEALGRSNYHLNIEFAKHGHTNPTGIIQDLKNEMNGKHYDILWVVFDHDGDDQEYNSAIQQLSADANRKNYLLSKINDYINDLSSSITITPRDSAYLSSCLKNSKIQQDYYSIINDLIKGISSKDIQKQKELNNLIADNEFLYGLDGYSNSIYYAASKPSFEIWILLHQKYTAQSFANSDEIISEIKQHVDWRDYSKEKKYTIQLYNKCRELSKEALKNTKKLFINQKAASGSTEHLNILNTQPITTFCLLFFELAAREWLNYDDFSFNAPYHDRLANCWVVKSESIYSCMEIKFKFMSSTSPDQADVTEEIFTKAIEQIKRVKYFCEYIIEVNGEDIKYIR